MAGVTGSRNVSKKVGNGGKVNIIYFVHSAEKIEWCNVATPFTWKISTQEIMPELECGCA
jgi:hypothetical protein